MSELAGRPPLSLTTSVPGLVMRDLDPSEARAFADLVARNRDHLLTGNGSVPPERVEDVVAWMCPRWDRNFGLALWLDDVLVGHITVSHLTHEAGDVEGLLAHSPDGWGIGYWLGSDHTGHGYAIEACRALMDHVRNDFGATDFYSGTLATNTKSQHVLERLGFEVYKTTDTFISYRLLERVSL